MSFLRYIMATCVLITLCYEQQAYGFWWKFKKNKSPQEKHIISVAHPSPKNPVQQKECFYQYLKGSYQQAKGDIPKSFQTFQSLLSSNPPLYAYDAPIQLLYETGQFEKIKMIYDRHEQFFLTKGCNNVGVVLTIAQALCNIGEQDKAQKLFNRLSEKHPSDERVAQCIAMALINANKLDQASAYLDTCIANKELEQHHFVFQFFKSKVALSQNNPNLALILIEKSLASFPKTDRRILLKAVLLEQLGRVNEAISCYSHFLDVVVNDTAVEQQLVALLFSQQRFAEAADRLKKISDNSAPYFFDLGLIESKAGKFDQAIAHLDKALEQDKLLVQAWLLKIELLLQQKKIAAALESVNAWFGNDIHNPSALHTLLLFKDSHLSIDQIIEHAEKLATKYASLPLYAILGDLYLDQQNTTKALNWYKRIEGLYPAADIQAKLFFQIGYIHYLAKQNVQAEIMLEKAVSAQNVYPSSYNLLAYHYAQQNKKLDRALQLIEKALAANATCSYFLDTKGYILMRMGKKQEAAGIFQKALTLAPNDAVIQEHSKLCLKG